MFSGTYDGYGICNAHRFRWRTESRNLYGKRGQWDSGAYSWKQCDKPDRNLGCADHLSGSSRGADSVDVWREWENLAICIGIYADLCGGEYFCHDDAGIEYVYHNTGICKDQYEDSSDRSNLQYHSWSFIYFCISYGRKGRGRCNDSLTGSFRRVGVFFFEWKTDKTSYPKRILKSTAADHSSGHGTWSGIICHEYYGEPYKHCI